MEAQVPIIIMVAEDMPYGFTEQGIAMLSAVLKSDVAVEVSIKIMNSFCGDEKIFDFQSRAVFKIG